MKSNEDVNIRHLHRNTIRIYYLLLRDGKEYTPMDVKETLSFSSRSTAFYHLNKLYLLNFVQKTQNGKYFVDDVTVKNQVIDRHIRYLTKWLPNSAVIVIYNLLLALWTLIFWIIKADLMVWLIILFPSFIINSIYIIIQSVSLTKDLQPKSITEIDEQT